MKKFKKIYVEITNICNKNCSFCLGSENKKQEMSIENFEKVLKQIKPHTNYIYLHVKGEPLTHSKFNEIINLCSKYKIIVNITTNGTLLNKHIDIIKKTDIIRQINISLQSIENEAEVKIFDGILSNVDQLLNETKIIFVYRLWAIKDNKLTETNKKIIDKLILHYQLDDIKEKIFFDSNIKLKENLYLNKAEIFEWPSLDNEFVSNEGFCYGLNSHVGILVDGTVIPCCLDSAGVIKLGNILKEDFKDILDKERTKKIIYGFKNNIVEEELCKRCSFRTRLKKNNKIML